MEKALEYIRGELKKDNKQDAQAPAAPPQQGDPPAADETFDASAHLNRSALPARDATCDRSLGNQVPRAGMNSRDYSRFD